MEANNFAIDTGYCPDQLKMSEVLVTPQDDGVVDQMTDAQRSACFVGLATRSDPLSRSAPHPKGRGVLLRRRHPSYLRDGGASTTRIATNGSARRQWLPS